MNRKKFDVHHVFPRSRFPHLRRTLGNLKLVDERRHAKFHALFGPATPCEAALTLLQEFGPLDADVLSDDPAMDSLVSFLWKIQGRRQR